MDSTFPDESKRKLENIVSKKMAQAHVPGASIALVKGDEVVYAKGFGARNMADNLPATPHTLYGIGSCTKSFTALAVMQLVGQGKLNIHEPVSEYLPFELGFEEAPITIHHLLSMSSGVPSLGTANVLIERMTGVGEKWIPMTTIEDFLRFVNNAAGEVAAKPDERYFYLNAGYTLIGEVVEQVGGMPYEDYIKEMILKPLEMDRSTFKKEEFEKDPDVMTAHWKEKDGKVNATVHPFHKLIYAPGGLLGPVTELTNYLFMNLNGGIYKGTEIVNATLLEAMHSVHTDRGKSIFGQNGYGYGWGIFKDFLGHRLIAHTGSTGVSSAFLGFIPDLKIGVALAANTGFFGSVIPHTALALLMGRDPEKELPYLAIDKSLSSLEGVYEAYEGTNRVSVAKKGPILYLEISNRWREMSAPLIPENDDPGNRIFNIYTEEGGKMPIEFVEGPEGQIDLYMERWRLHRIGQPS